MDVLSVFHRTGALHQGHFVLRSGRHSRQFFQCARLLMHARLAAEVVGELAAKVREAGIAFDAIISPAMGGILLGQELARHLDSVHFFTEKVEGRLALRRFEITPGQRFLVAEDVVTTGSAVHETIRVVQEAGGTVVAVAIIVLRGKDEGITFGVPLIRLLDLQVETFAPDALPPDLAALPAVKPGSQ
jgi:orotate phosphoribosyltransferase